MLVVDDDPRLREFMRVNLELEGYTVREASSAEDALDAIEDQAPALVLLDVVMPGVDGWQMLQRMQERYGSLDPGDHVQRQGRRGRGRRPRSAAPRLRRQAVRPAELIERAKQLVPVLTVSPRPLLVR